MIARHRPPPSPAPPAPRSALDHRRRLIVILGALSAFGPLTIDMYLPALPRIAADLHGRASTVQLTLTACLVGLALGQLVIGPLSDTLGRRRPLLVGLAAFVAGSLFCVVATTVPQLVALRVLQGVGGSAGIVIARAIVRDLYSGIEAARFYSLLLLVNGLAPILAPIAGGQLIRVASWRVVFVVLALIGLALLVIAALDLVETLPPERRRGGGIRPALAGFAGLLRDRVFCGLVLTGGFGFAAMFAYIAASPFVLQLIYGISPQVFGLLFGVNALGIMAAAQGGGRLVRRVGPARLLQAGLGVGALGAALLVAGSAFHLGLAGVLPGFFLVASSVGLIAPNAVALALSEHPQVAGSAAALIGVAQYVIGGVAAPLVGVAGSRSQLPVVVIIAVCSTAAVLCFVGLARSAPTPGKAAA